MIYKVFKKWNVRLLSFHELTKFWNSSSDVFFWQYLVRNGWLSRQKLKNVSKLPKIVFNRKSQVFFKFLMNNIWDFSNKSTFFSKSKTPIKSLLDFWYIALSQLVLYWRVEIHHKKRKVNIFDPAIWKLKNTLCACRPCIKEWDTSEPWVYSYLL